MIVYDTDNHSNFYLFKYALMAFSLSFLGLPLYTHLPKFYHDYYGVSLSTIGIILFSSRILDAVIDPIFGVLSDRFHFTQKKYFIIFSLGLVCFFNAFFHVPSTVSEEFYSWWFGFCTVFVYLCFSMVFINYYNLGLHIVKTNPFRAKLSSFRELLGFFGMITASIMPSLLIQLLGNELNAFIIYGIMFSFFVILGLIFLPIPPLLPQQNYKKKLYENTIHNLTYIYCNDSMRWLIIIFFINSIPIAITSNLFSFYVDQVLSAKSSMALFLISYLLSGATSAIVCSLFFRYTNRMRLLLIMMIISAVGFSITCFLYSANSYIFYFVCILSGFGLGGELVMLPAIASDVMKEHLDYGNTFFALWASCTKITLAIAAGIFLPLISLKESFLPDMTMSNKIAFFYAVIPLIIKCISIAIVFCMKSKILRGLT